MAQAYLQSIVREALAVLERLRRGADPDPGLAAGAGGLFRGGRAAGELRAAEAVHPVHRLFNVSGQPAVNVPLHWSGDGLPIGVMLAGRMGGKAP